MPGLLSGAIESAAFRLQHRRIRHQFRQALGYEGDFENPRSYQEKVQFRKLYGNHELYARVADKFRVRDYVAARVGDPYLVPLLAVHSRLTPRSFEPLPDRFIIKATHGCKWNQVVRDRRELDVDATVRRFNKYARARYGHATGERHYAFIHPRIVIEELLQGPAGGGPWDYSFFAYNGPRGYDYSYAIAAPDGRAASFTREGELLESAIPEQELAPHLQPATFTEMVEVARALCAGFDFVRVDLYSVGPKVYFGELTCTPHQGYTKINNPRCQRLRDEMWQLDAYNPQLYRAPPAHGAQMLPSRLQLPVGPSMQRAP